MKSTAEILKYFQNNLFESYGAYNCWKMLCFSKSRKVVSPNMAEKYVEIQNYYPNFFIATERACLVNFVLQVLHSFDEDQNSYSLQKADSEKTRKFIHNNNFTITALRNIRNKLFAHRDMRVTPEELRLPSVNDLDAFFNNLFSFYNELTREKQNSSTLFDNAEEVKSEVEEMFKNLHRGESVRKSEVNIKWLWDEDGGKASGVL